MVSAKELHSLERKVNVWTVDGPKSAELLVQMGVDYITSNILELKKWFRRIFGVKGADIMHGAELTQLLEDFPVIAAVHEDKFQDALASPVDVIFSLEPHLLSIEERTSQAHAAGKVLFVHLAMAAGIGQDKEGLQYLASCGVDGIISTKGHIIRTARDLGFLTVQRFFALDSQGVSMIHDTLKTNLPHFIEIMPGVIPKIIKQFSSGPVPVIAGGLIETRQEVTAALSNGALAISTGCNELWNE